MNRTPIADQLLGLATELGHLRPWEFIARRRLADIHKRLITLSQGVARTERFQAEVLAEVAEEHRLMDRENRARSRGFDFFGATAPGNVVPLLSRMRRSAPGLGSPPKPRGAA